MCACGVLVLLSWFCRTALNCCHPSHRPPPSICRAVANAQTFPYARCEVGGSKTPFGVANDVYVNAAGAYCFVIKKDSCPTANACCSMSIDKFDLDASEY